MEGRTTVVRFLAGANSKKICREAESNHRHGDFQSPALPTELSRHIYIANILILSAKDF